MTVTGVSPSLAQTVVSPFERAILETLAYSDIFDYPLTLDELHRYLTAPAKRAELAAQLPYLQLMASENSGGVYYHLPGRGEIVGIRKAREENSIKSFQRALFYGKILSLMPFVRMVAMTGSLAMLNLSKNADMDFMLVASPNRLWIARAFAVTFGRLMRLLGDRICVNLLVSENALAWPRHDLYSAREMGQMIPIAGLDMYRRLRDANPWVESFLPNASSTPERTPAKPAATGMFLQRFVEFFIPGRFGAWLDKFLMKIQLRKILRKYGKGANPTRAGNGAESGLGAETNFSADVCQGNFHDHRKWADEYYQARLLSLGLEIGEGIAE